MHKMMIVSEMATVRNWSFSVIRKNAPAPETGTGALAASGQEEETSSPLLRMFD